MSVGGFNGIKLGYCGNNNDAKNVMKGCDCMINNASKRTILSVAVLASALMIIALVITSAARGVPADVPAVLTEARSDNGYWLRPYNGHIAVYNHQGDDSPMIETTIDVEGLRAVDRTQLEEGIGANTYEDVLKLLEDFGS
jgi:hypothetical protein